MKGKQICFLGLEIDSPVSLFKAWVQIAENHLTICFLYIFHVLWEKYHSHVIDKGGSIPIFRETNLFRRTAMPQSRRDHLMTVARDLFMEHGFHGTGIDKILGVAGVSKKTLYTHFRSKDELILAVLKEHDGSFRNHFMRQVEQTSSDPRTRLMAVFDVAEAWFETPSFYGCVFINAVGEYSKADTPIRNACRDFKQQMTDYIVRLAKETGAADPTSLGNQLSLLLEGAIVTAQVSDREIAIDSARSAAAILIDKALEN